MVCIFCNEQLDLDGKTYFTIYNSDGHPIDVHGNCVIRAKHLLLEMESLRMELRKFLNMR